MENALDQLRILQRRYTFLEEENHFLREQLRLARAGAFGRFSAVLPDAAQLSLFAADQVPENRAPEQAEGKPEREKSSESRGKSGRKKLNPDLETVEEVVDIPEEDKVCSCGCLKSRIGEETSQKLEYVPARARIIQTIRPKYACQACEGVGAEGPTVSIAPPPAALIAKSIVTPSLMTHLLLSKIVDSIPLYRQEMQLERLGVTLSRGSMANWMITLGQKCAPLIQMLIEMAKKRTAINLDETTIQVMNEQGRKNTSISYMWLLRAGPPLIPKEEKEAEIVVYQYHPTREASFAKAVTSGFRGFVQTDDYAGYRFLHGKDAEEQGWVHVHCLAHVRRLFVEAAKACHGQKRQKTLGLSAQLVQDIAKIYKTESKAKEQAADEAELIRLRQETVLPLLQALEDKIKQLISEVPPMSTLGKALVYAAKVLPQVRNYAGSAYLTLDNNPIENKVRPFALGRKNWLFSNTPEGATALAIWYSLLETAKANGWNPQTYLLHLLEGLRLSAPLPSLLPTNSPPAD